MGFTDRVHRIHDTREIVTADFLIKKSRYKIYMEGGFGSVHNPASSGATGAAISVGFNLYNTKLGLPLFLQVYSVDVNVAALESAVLNANASVVQGGYGTDPKYNNGYYPAFLQEVGMMSNNRNGAILKIDKVSDRFQVELGNAVSQEKQNIFQGVSFEQMVNAFSRSRFSPWTQNAGPYGRINNRFRRSFETLAITDSGNYKKAFNSADLTLKMKIRLFKRDIILSNYCFAGSVGKTISPIPVWNTGSFVRSFFEEFSAYVPLKKNVMLLGFYSIQINKANGQTQLAENGKPLDQIGTGFGFGIDYDFASNAGIFLRHRWMEQKDENFTADRFKGTETMVELKVFF